MSAIRKLRVFLSIGHAGRRLLVETTALSACVSVGFRFFGVPRSQDLLRRWGLAKQNSRPPADGNVVIRNILRAQRIVRRSTGLAENCLVKSMVLWVMLLRRGLSPTLRVGFRKRDGEIQGHAWVENNGVPINEAPREAATFEVYDQPASFDLWWKQKRNQPIG